jgi:hypothetical protein
MQVIGRYKSLAPPNRSHHRTDLFFPSPYVSFSLADKACEAEEEEEELRKDASW